MDTKFTNYSIISRKVIDAFLMFRDRDRQDLLIIDWLGVDRAVVPVQAQERAADRSSYTLAQLVRVATDRMFFQSTAFLRWIVYCGFLVALASGALVAYTLVSVASEGTVPQWTDFR